jgi:hypothetical protein
VVVVGSRQGGWQGKRVMQRDQFKGCCRSGVSSGLVHGEIVKETESPGGSN